ncbi:acyl-CoA dehydrogenase family protein [Frankia sp. Mgl5]|uniref:acyl-CoA dehydrogenase family protein n=1 Tax=Frankia sp. Mgl5 TaxID=2933793 RepID=UPI002010680F|nr:acyl-CoA dehydrogenase family protein [Frankia sp. Mgl5]MCK9929703.1 acyl-CoA dehydrogenase family protein [Frankia sp. Mgl5]
MTTLPQAHAEETEQWLTRVEKVTGLLAEHRSRAEEDRATSPEVIDALREQGFHRMWVSRAFGGAGVSLRTGSAVLQAIARTDPSAAWQMGVQGAIGRISDYLSDQAACRIFCSSHGLVVGGINPTGQAVPVPGGYRLRGRWSFASGATHADWLVASAVVTGGCAQTSTNAPARRSTPAHAPTQVPAQAQVPVPGSAPTGSAPIRMLCVPRGAATFTDDWHALGLRGTGSGTFTVDNIVVPESQTVDGSLLRRPPTARKSRGYAIAYYDFAPFTTASTTLGIAQDALRAFRQLALQTVPARATETLAGGHTVQATFARATALVRASRLMLEDAADQATERGENGGDELSGVIRLAAAAVGENCVQAVTMLHTAAGASALRSGGDLDRCFRDVHTAVRHITLAATNFEMVGAHLFGDTLLMRR